MWLLLEYALQSNPGTRIAIAENRRKTQRKDQ